MQHTFILKAGKRLTLRPDATARGRVQVQVQSADRLPLVTVSVEPDLLRAIGEACERMAIVAAAQSATFADVGGV